MIKAIIFDVGGVLIRTVDHRPRRMWEKKLGLAEWESETIVFGGSDPTSAGNLAQAGTITTEALWQTVGQRLNLADEELQQFRRAFWQGDVLDEGLISFIRSLRRTYQTAIISNATDSLRHTLETVYPIADAFDLIVCSAEEKVMKPRPEIFWRTLERLGRKPEETVFVDDFAHNVAAAQQVGMHTIHFHPLVDVAAALGELGVRLPDK